MAKKWKDVRAARLSPERLAAIDEWVEKELTEIDLREIRSLLGVRQEELAEAVGVTQGELSRMEHRNDYRLSTIRRYVRALGGDVEVRAVFGDKSVKLSV